MNLKVIFASICACFLFLATAQAGTPQAQPPTWKVGDTWAMGAKDLDLTPLLYYVIQNMREKYEARGMSIDADLTGTLTVYEIFKVEEVQTTQYKVAVSLGLETNVGGTVTTTFFGKTYSGSLNFTLTMKADGFDYFTKDSLALAKEEMSGDIDLTMSMAVAGQTADITIDATFQLTMTYDTPLDIFNFPIEVGDSWTAESSAVLTGTVSGKMVMAGMGEKSISLPLENTTFVSADFQCPSTANVTLEDGSVSTCYKITQSGVRIGDVSPTPLGGTLYYSPDRGFIVRQDLTGLPGTMGTAGELSLGGIGSTASLGTLNPVTEQEAKSGIAAIGVKGINIVVIAIIAIVIVAIVVAVLLVRRRRAASEFEFPTEFEYPT